MIEFFHNWGWLFILGGILLGGRWLSHRIPPIGRCDHDGCMLTRFEEMNKDE